MRPLLLAACLLLAPLPALATTPNFSYDYLDVGHVTVMPQDGGNGSSIFGDVSYSFMNAVQLVAGYQKPSYPAGLSSKDYDIGIAAEDGIDDRTDVYTDILYLNRRDQALNTITTQDGYRLEVGLRRRAWQRVELDGWLAHNYLDSPSNEAGVGLLVDVTSWLSLGLSYSHDSQFTNITSLRARFYF
ncbi:MAG TPA: hypothetical protein VGN70_11810 [Gammaproteobacteria bacterium]